MPFDRNKFKQIGNDIDVSETWPAKGEPLTIGESVEGRYIERLDDIGQYKSKVYVIVTPSGERIGVWGGAVIDDHMKEVSFGTEVAFEFAGMGKSKGGATYKRFIVAVGGVAEGFSDGSSPEQVGAMSGEPMDDDEVPF